MSATLPKAAPADRGGEFVALERECEATLDLKWFRGGFIRGVAGLAASVLQASVRSVPNRRTLGERDWRGLTHHTKKAARRAEAALSFWRGLCR